MWAVAVTIGATENAVATRLRLLGLDVFYPYTVEKQRIKVRARPRAVYKMVRVELPRWPRYLFCKTENDEQTNLIRMTRDVGYLVKGAEGFPALLNEEAMNEVRRGCDTSGRVVRRASSHDFSVGDLLSFVAGSSLAGLPAQVLSVEDNGVVRVLVNDYLKVTVDHKDLAA